MKKTTHIFFTTVALVFSASVSAQDIDNTIQLDSSQIQQLACMANSLSQQSSSSFDNIGSILNETLALYGEGLSEEELQSTYDEANQAVAGLDIETSMQQLCNGSGS